MSGASGALTGTSGITVSSATLTVDNTAAAHMRHELGDITDRQWAEHVRAATDHQEQA